MPKLSIIVPVFFNDANLPTTIPLLLEIMGRLDDMQSELIMVDDGSGDRSFSLLKEYTTHEPRLKVIRLAKNFGAHTALLAGLDHATGDCITFIMADLQDPPELIPAMIEKWRAGSKIVIAERQEREDRWMDRVFASFFWRFMRRFGLKNLPRGGFDFVLFDRQVANTITSMREKNSHLMLQLLWTGFTPAIIPYTRRERKVGKSKWTFSKKIKLFIDSAIGFSYLPIRLMSTLGITVACIGFLGAVYIFIERLRIGTPVTGWTSLMVAVLILGGLQMVMIGMIGEYLWRTYDETRQRPSYVIDEIVN